MCRIRTTQLRYTWHHSVRRSRPGSCCSNMVQMFTCGHKRSTTSLHFASSHGSHSVLRVLLERGTDVNAQDTNHSTPLHVALYLPNPQISTAHLLLESDANVHMRDKLAETLLHLASRGGYGIMRVSLERGVDVNVQNTNHWTLCMRHYSRGVSRSRSCCSNMVRMFTCGTVKVRYYYTSRLGPLNATSCGYYWAEVRM